MYAVHILTVVCLYIILASGANLAVGYTGLVSLGQAALCAVGAYVSTLLVMDLGASFSLAALAGVAGAAALAVLISFVLLRLGDDYFVVATIGLQLIVWSVLNNWQSLTRGPLGIPGIPGIPGISGSRILGFSFSRPVLYLSLLAAIAVLVVWACQRLADSPYGRVLRAIREDPTFASSMGKNLTFYKVSVMTFGGATAGLAGVLYAPFFSFIDPTGFTLSESLLILSMVIVGGAGDLRGPVLGAFLLVVLPESLRFLGLPAPIAANVRQILYGLLLIFMMLFRPQGILGSYRFERRGHSTL